MSNKFILAKDGYFYQLTDNYGYRSICIKCVNENAYTVHPDRYILDLNRILYRIARTIDPNVIKIQGYDCKYYNVVDEKIFVHRKRIEDLDLESYECLGPNPIPQIHLSGEGTHQCNPDTGLCHIDAPKGTKVSIGTPRGFRTLFDRDRAYLKVELE